MRTQAPPGLQHRRSGDSSSDRETASGRVEELGIVVVAVGLWLAGRRVHPTRAEGSYSSDQYWIGKGQGDLTKGKAVCQRVSELSARTDLGQADPRVGQGTHGRPCP